MVQVSTIIPAFNALAYIEGAIASATQQEGVTLEIIVVDDCSTDATAAIVRGLAEADPRVTLLALPVNGGPSVARNAGIAAARGTWIALLDADDSFESGRLATLVALGEARNADLVADNLWLIDEMTGEKAAMMPPGFLPMPRRMHLPEFIARNISTPNAPRTNFGFLKPLMRRSFIAARDLRYDEQVRFAEDFALYVEALRAGANWWLHPEPMYRYLVRQGSLTQVQTTGDLDRLRQRQRRLLAEARKAGDAEFVTLIRRHLRNVERCYYYRGFTDELKVKRLGAALRYLFGGRDSILLVVQEGMRQLPTVVRKVLRGGYQTGQ